MIIWLFFSISRLAPVCDWCLKSKVNQFFVNVINRTGKVLKCQTEIKLKSEILYIWPNFGLMKITLRNFLGTLIVSDLGSEQVLSTLIDKKYSSLT